MKDKFSIKNFAIGFLAGVALVVVLDAAVVSYAVNAVKQGTWESVSGVRNVIEVVRQSLHEESEKGDTSTSGILTRVGESDFEIEASMLKGKVTLRFTYDASTQFIKTQNDDENTPIPVNPHDMELGQDVAVVANEPIGSVENQHAVKVVDF